MIFLSGYGLKSWSSHEMDPHINNKPAGFLAKNPSLFSHFVVTSFRLSQFQPYFISRHHHCDLCFCWPWHWSKDYMKNTKKIPRGKHKTCNNNKFASILPKWREKLSPLKVSGAFFQKHHHLGAHLLQLEFGRWSSTSHTHFFDRPWPTKKYTEPPRRCQWGAQQKTVDISGRLCDASQFHCHWNSIFAENWMDNTSPLSWYSTYPIETFSTIATTLPVNLVQENWHGTQQLVFSRRCSFSKKPFQFPY